MRQNLMRKIKLTKQAGLSRRRQTAAKAAQTAMLGAVVMRIISITAVELNLLDALGGTNLCPDFIGIAKPRIRQRRKDKPPQQRK